MAFKIVLKGEEPSGRILALLCARTGETIDLVRRSLQSSQGLTLKEGLSREKAEEIHASLPGDGSVKISIQRDIDSWVAVLMGYRPGSRGRLRVALQKMSRLSTEEVIHFLANIPIALKAGIPRKTAEAIKDALEREGGIVEIRPFTGISDDLQESVDTESSPGTQLESEPGNENQTETHPPGEPPGKKPSVPPPVEEIAASLKPVMNVQPPYVVRFECPSKEAVSAPPIPDSTSEMFANSSLPYPIKFTIPARHIPRVVDIPGVFSPPPDVSGDSRVVPLYLHPVSDHQKDWVCAAMCEVLGLSESRCRDLVDRAPVAIWACRERLNALVTLRGLSERGVPVSLIPSESSTSKSTNRRTFFGWLNGNQ